MELGGISLFHYNDGAENNLGHYTAIIPCRNNGYAYYDGLATPKIKPISLRKFLHELKSGLVSSYDKVAVSGLYYFAV